jgi:hypothetical protein
MSAQPIQSPPGPYLIVAKANGRFLCQYDELDEAVAYCRRWPQTKIADADEVAAIERREGVNHG